MIEAAYITVSIILLSVGIIAFGIYEFFRGQSTKYWPTSEGIVVFSELMEDDETMGAGILSHPK